MNALRRVIANHASVMYGLGRYTLGLRRYARERISLEMAEEEIRRGVAQRHEALLAMLRR